jgi:spore maturation protein CgeB
VAAEEHAAFYCAQRFTLNVTREHERQAGWSPSARLFEAAACGVPTISDHWPGVEQFFEPGREILLASSCDDVLALLCGLPETERRQIAERARERVLRQHTAAHRAATLEREAINVIAERENRFAWRALS